MNTLLKAKFRLGIRFITSVIIIAFLCQNAVWAGGLSKQTLHQDTAKIISKIFDRTDPLTVQQAYRMFKGPQQVRRFLVELQQTVEAIEVGTWDGDYSEETLDLAKILLQTMIPGLETFSLADKLKEFQIDGLSRKPHEILKLKKLLRELLRELNRFEIEAGAPYRSITPENVIIVRDNTGILKVKLRNPGTARNLDFRGDQESRYNSLGNTPPDAVLSNEADLSIDIFQVGILLYILLVPEEGHPFRSRKLFKGKDVLFEKEDIRKWVEWLGTKLQIFQKSTNALNEDDKWRIASIFNTFFYNPLIGLEFPSESWSMFEFLRELLRRGDFYEELEGATESFYISEITGERPESAADALIYLDRVYVAYYDKELRYNVKLMEYLGEGIGTDGERNGKPVYKFSAVDEDGMYVYLDSSENPLPYEILKEEYDEQFEPILLHQEYIEPLGEEESPSGPLDVDGAIAQDKDNTGVIERFKKALTEDSDELELHELQRQDVEGQLEEKGRKRTLKKLLGTVISELEMKLFDRCDGKVDSACEDLRELQRNIDEYQFFTFNENNFIDTKDSFVNAWHDIHGKRILIGRQLMEDRKKDVGIPRELVIHELICATLTKHFGEDGHYLAIIIQQEIFKKNYIDEYKNYTFGEKTIGNLGKVSCLFDQKGLIAADPEGDDLSIAKGSLGVAIRGNIRENLLLKNPLITEIINKRPDDTESNTNILNNLLKWQKPPEMEFEFREIDELSDSEKLKQARKILGLEKVDDLFDKDVIVSEVVYDLICPVAISIFTYYPFYKKRISSSKYRDAIRNSYLLLSVVEVISRKEKNIRTLLAVEEDGLLEDTAKKEVCSLVLADELVEEVSWLLEDDRFPDTYGFDYDYNSKIYKHAPVYFGFVLRILRDPQNRERKIIFKGRAADLLYDAALFITRVFPDRFGDMEKNLYLIDFNRKLGRRINSSGSVEEGKLMREKTWEYLNSNGISEYDNVLIVDERSSREGLSLEGMTSVLMDNNCKVQHIEVDSSYGVVGGTGYQGYSGASDFSFENAYFASSFLSEEYDGGREIRNINDIERVEDIFEMRSGKAYSLKYIEEDYVPFWRLKNRLTLYKAGLLLFFGEGDRSQMNDSYTQFRQKVLEDESVVSLGYGEISSRGDHTYKDWIRGDEESLSEIAEQFGLDIEIIEQILKDTDRSKYYKQIRTLKILLCADNTLSEDEIELILSTSQEIMDTKEDIMKLPGVDEDNVSRIQGSLLVRILIKKLKEESKSKRDENRTEMSVIIKKRDLLPFTLEVFIAL